MVVVGVDPGTGIKSPTGFVCFRAETLEIIAEQTITSKYKKVEHKYKDICDQFELLMLELSNSQVSNEPVLVVFESFVMLGKAGETLQRLIGSLMGRVPYHFKVTHVSNMRVKLIVGGTGKADKALVGSGVAKVFESNVTSSKIISRLIKEAAWDVLDAFAIGIAGVYYEGANQSS